MSEQSHCMKLLSYLVRLLIGLNLNHNLTHNRDKN